MEKKRLFYLALVLSVTVSATGIAWVVGPLLLGTSAWAVGPIPVQGTTPNPATTLKPVPIPAVNPTPASPAGTVQQAKPQTAPQAQQTALQAQQPSQQAKSTLLGFLNYMLPDVKVKEYFSAMMQGLIYPYDASGVLTSSFTNPNVSATSPPDFHNLGYLDTISVCIPLTNVCWSGTYGTKVDLSFDVSGPVTYTYNVPYAITFSFPASVYPGQRIYLAPTFVWPQQPPPTITSTMDYTYSQATSFWADAPFDFMDALTLGFTQYNNKVHLSWGIPVVPGFSSYKDAADLTFWPFSTGSCEYRGSYSKGGGTGSLTNAGPDPTGGLPTSVWIYSPAGTSDTAWKAGNEQFALTAAVLEAIPPPVNLVGAALDVVRFIGDFQLNTQIEGSITRLDYVVLELSDLPYVDVPMGPAISGGVWNFSDQPVTLNYRVYGVSTFYYNLGGSLTFHMIGYDTKPLWSLPTWAFFAGSSMSPWQYRSGVFKISGKIPVQPLSTYRTELVFDASHPLGNTAQAPSKQQMIIREPAGAKIATPQQMPRVIKASRTVPFPTPTALRGTPQGGEYTVVLGAAAAARADKIVALLKSKGISAYTVTGSGTTELVVTLGVFLDRAQAKLLAGMLNEIFKIDGDVVQSISGVKFRPLGDDVVQKLNKPL